MNDKIKHDILIIIKTIIIYDTLIIRFVFSLNWLIIIFNILILII